MPLTPDELMYYLNPSMDGDVPLTGKKAVQKRKPLNLSLNTPKTPALPTMMPAYDPYLEDVRLDQYSSELWGSPLEDRELTVGDIPRLGEIAADSQSGLANVLVRGPLRTAVPAVTKWLQGWAMLGAAGYGAAKDLLEDESAGDTNILEFATDNAVVNGLQLFEDYFKQEVVPVYKRDDWGQMNVWEKLSTDPTSWGADELADGVAFAASALFGGGLVGKLLKPGTRLMGGLATAARAEGNIAKGLSALTSAEKALPALKGLENFALKAGTKMDNAAAWSLMTGQEALFETKEYIETATQSYMKDLGLNEDEARNMAVEQAPTIFAANMAILGISNAWELSRLGKLMGAPSEGMGRIVRDGLKGKEQYLTNMGRWMNTTEAGFRTKLALQGFAAEGLWEENMQGAVKDVLKNYGLSANREYGVGEFAGDALAQGLANVFDPDKHEEILLGAILGGGMSQFAAGKEFKSLRNRTEAVLNNINNSTDNMLDANNLFVKEDVLGEDGQVVEQKIKLDEQGNPVINPEKVADLQKNMKELADLEKATQAQLANGNLDAAEVYADAATDKWIRAHLEAGLEGQLKEKLKAMSKFTPEELEKLGIPTTGFRDGKPLTLQDNIRRLEERVDYMINLNNTLENSISLTSKFRDARIKEGLRIAGITETLKGQRSSINQKLALAESKLYGENAPYNKALADLEVLDTLEQMNEATTDPEEKQSNKERIAARRERANSLLDALREGNDQLPKTNEYVGLTGPELLEYKDAKRKSIALENNIINLSTLFDKIADNRIGDAAIAQFAASQIEQKDSDLKAVVDNLPKDSAAAKLFTQKADNTIVPNGNFFVIEQTTPRKSLTVFAPWRNPKTGAYVLRPLSKMKVKGPSTSDIALDEIPEGTVMTKEEIIAKNREIIRQNKGYDFIQALYKRRRIIKQELSSNSEAWSALFNLDAKILMYKRQLQQALETLSGEELATTVASIESTINELVAEQQFVEEYINQLEEDLKAVNDELQKYVTKETLPTGEVVTQFATEQAELDAGAVLDIEATLRQELDSLNRIKSDYQKVIDNLKELLNKVIDAINAIIGRPKGDRRTKEGATKELLRSLELSQEKKAKERFETELQDALAEVQKIDNRIAEINQELSNLPYIARLYGEVIADYSVENFLEEYTSNTNTTFEEPTNTPAPSNMRKKDKISSSAGLHAEYEINGDKISTKQTEEGAVLNQSDDVIDLVTFSGTEVIAKAALRFYNFMSTFRLRPGTSDTVYFKAELGSQATDAEVFAETAQINLVLYQNGQPVLDSSNQKLAIPMHLPSYVERLNLSEDTDPELVYDQWAQLRKETAEKLLKGEAVYFKVNGKSTGMLNYKARQNNRRGISSIFGSLLGSPEVDLAIISPKQGEELSDEAKTQNKEMRRLRRALVKQKVGMALTNPQGDTTVKIGGKEYPVPDGGALYVLFQMGDGREYPVRLNTRYASKSDGRMVVDLLNYARKGTTSLKLKNTNMALPIFGSKTKEGLIDMLVRWGQGNNPETQIYIEGGTLTADATLVFGSNKMPLSELDKLDKQEELINWIEANKLRNISKSMFDKAMGQKDDAARGFFEVYAIDTATNEVLYNRWDSYLDYLFTEKRNDGAYHTPIVGTDVVSRNSDQPQILQSYLTYDPIISSEPPTGGNNVSEDVEGYPYWKVKQRSKPETGKNKFNTVAVTTSGWGSVPSVTPTGQPQKVETTITTSLKNDPWFSSSTAKQQPVNQPVETKVPRSVPNTWGAANLKPVEETSAIDPLSAAALDTPSNLPTNTEVEKKENDCNPFE